MENNPKVTIVIPCLNEERLIADVITDCRTGLEKATIAGQILIMDGGTDGSGEIARELGAEVVKPKKLGLGLAYIESLPHIKNNFVIMGDADGTYDYKEINVFIEKLDQGYDFVMGTRLKGWIEKDAMPKLHRYFGTPLTTWLLNRLFNLNFSDVQCGMRAMTKEALEKIDLKSRGWEYAPEMVVKAGLLRLKTTEVPIHFYKDKKGRISHLKRGGWLTPWYAGWVSLKIMLLYAPNFVFFIPGVSAFLLGSIIIFACIFDLIPQLQFHFALLGLVLTIIGYLVIQLGLLSKVFSDLNKYYKDKLVVFVEDNFSYDKGMLFGGLIVLSGFIFSLFLLSQWVTSGLKLERISTYGISGLTLITLGFQTLFFTFIYEVFRISKEDN
ncbi:MAG TPA: glycosyltransferase family 2 protein [Candidatus Saccharimonadales bacterium]|nr:glycosyltransferase family 2 protein [Candidatus Saccharimonadales bacterium]